MKKNNLFRFSWFGFGSIGLLLAIISFFTISTLNKQEESLNLLVAERGIAFVDVYEKIIITSVYSGLPFDLNSLTEDFVESQNFNFTMVADEDGLILLHNDATMIGQKIDLHDYFGLDIEVEEISTPLQWLSTEISNQENILVYKKLYKPQRNSRNASMQQSPFESIIPNTGIRLEINSFRERSNDRDNNRNSDRNSRNNNYTEYEFQINNHNHSSILPNIAEIDRFLSRDTHSLQEYLTPVPSKNPISMALQQRKDVFIFVAQDMSMHNQSKLNSKMVILFASFFIALAAIILITVLQYIARNEAIQTKQAEKLQAIGDLTAGVAHEIRNPLSSIKGYATFFKQKFPENSTEQEAASIMAEEVDRLNRAIDNLVGLSRTIDIKLENTNITEVCTKIALLLETELIQREINLVFDSEKIGDICADIDPDKFKQALLNLLLNSMEAFDDSIENKIISLSIIKKNKLIHIAICDNGLGVKKEIRERVFDPYFTTKTQGTGLGLAMVKNIVEAHNGKLELEINNEKELGTCFIIHLPA